jgi:tripartite-type tricarboxylate transporter receptor subunit TctC
VIAQASAGSTVDLMARLVYEQVGRQLGQTIVVEEPRRSRHDDRHGLCREIAARWLHDFGNSTSYAAVASTYARLPYDPVNDMTGIALLAHILFVVASSTKYKTPRRSDRCSRILRSGHEPRTGRLR